MTTKRALGIAGIIVVVAALAYFLGVFRPHMGELGKIEKCYINMMWIGTLLRNVDDEVWRESRNIDAFMEQLEQNATGNFRRDMLECADTHRPFGFCACPRGRDPSNWVLLWDDLRAHKVSWRHKLVPQLAPGGYTGSQPPPSPGGGTRVLRTWNGFEFIKSLSGRPYDGCIVLFADGRCDIVPQSELVAKLKDQGVQQHN